MLRLSVTNAEAAVASMGIPVASEGGAIQTLTPGGTRAAILAAPDNLFIQVIQ